MYPEFTLYWIIAEILISFVAVSSSVYLGYKANKIFQLSTYRTLKYFSYAFYFFGIALAIRFLSIIIAIILPEVMNRSIAGLLLGFLAGYFAAAGGLMLAYSMVRKYIQHSDGKSNFKLIHLMALLISTLQSLAIVKAGTEDFYIVSSTMVIALLFALIANFSHEKRDTKGLLDPFYMVVLLSFLIFIVLILAGVLSTIFPISVTVGYAVLALLFLLLVYQVRRITKRL